MKLVRTYLREGSSAMRVVSRLSIALAASVLLIGSSYALARPAPVALQAQAAQEPAPVSGELVRVNPDTKSLAVKTSTGAEMQFRYTDQTVVTGGEKSVAGLATMNGAQVTIQFKTEGNVNIATRIDVRSK